MRKNTLFLVSFFFSFITAHCQNPFETSDFSSVDSLAKTIKYENDIYELTKQLTQPYSKQLYKARSIFIWITENLKYDWKFINKGKEIKQPDCSGKIDCSAQLKDWENDYIKNVLKKKKAICDGYSRLFKKMCEIAGIECEIISGYARTKPYQVGNPISVNHSWNAIKLDSSYYFLDATWAAGYCIEDEETGKLVEYKKDYKNYYWLTPFNKLARNHYPEKGNWVYEANFTKEKFFQNPYYRSDILEDIDLLSPSSGVVDARKGDTIRFRLEYKNRIKFIQINSNAFRNPSIFTEKKKGRKISYVLDSFALKKQQYITFTQTGSLYEFSYVVTDNSIYYVDVLFDYKQVMRFKIKNE